MLLHVRFAGSASGCFGFSDLVGRLHPGRCEHLRRRFGWAKSGLTKRGLNKLRLTELGLAKLGGRLPHVGDQSERRDESCGHQRIAHRDLPISPALLAFLPPHEVLEQLFAVRRIAGWLLLEEPAERLAKRGLSARLPLEPALCRSKSPPTRQHLRQIHLSPFGMVSVTEKFGKPREQRFDKMFQELKPLAAGRPVVGEESAFDRDRVDAFTGPNDVWVILAAERRWQIILAAAPGNRELAAGECHPFARSGPGR